ncbi:MAG: hypothetical protein ACRD2C_17745 [Acidimicrobiales bacterium]
MTPDRPDHAGTPSRELDRAIRQVIERAPPLTGDLADQLRCLLPPPPSDQTGGTADAA